MESKEQAEMIAREAAIQTMSNARYAVAKKLMAVNAAYNTLRRAGIKCDKPPMYDMDRSEIFSLSDDVLREEDSKEIRRDNRKAEVGY
jgi:hypothetical protein